MAAIRQSHRVRLFPGTYGSGFWDDVVGVSSFVDALVFLVDVVWPVGVEVAVADQGAEFEDGFGAVQAPAGAGDVEAILDPRWRQAPSMMPVAIGQPWARAVG